MVNSKLSTTKRMHEFPTSATHFFFPFVQIQRFRKLRLFIRIILVFVLSHQRKHCRLVIRCYTSLTVNSDTNLRAQNHIIPFSSGSPTGPKIDTADPLMTTAPIKEESSLIRTQVKCQCGSNLQDIQLHRACRGSPSRHFASAAPERNTYTISPMTGNTKMTT